MTISESPLFLVHSPFYLERVHPIQRCLGFSSGERIEIRDKPFGLSFKLPLYQTSALQVCIYLQNEFINVNFDHIKYKMGDNTTTPRCSAPLRGISMPANEALDGLAMAYLSIILPGK